jgi:APA family basic amino acid/polyamine antiporter
MFPNAGGIYEFSKQAYGRFPSFLIGWTTWLVGNITTTVMIVSAMNYIMPDSSLAPIKIIISLALIFFLNGIAYRGIEASTKIVIVFAIITLGAVALIIFPGIIQIEPTNLTPLFTAPSIFILVSLFFIVESFFGWESITFLSEETKNPQRVIPKSLIISTAIVGIITILISLITLGIIPWQQLGQTPFTHLSAILYGPGAIKYFSIAIFISLIGSAAGGIVSSPRLLLALARDKLFIDQLADIHPKFRTPYKAIFFQTLVSILVLVVSFGAYKMLLSLLVPLGLLMYITVFISVVVLR